MKTELNDILNIIADKLNLATSKQKAIELNQNKYLILENNSTYGGYRVVNVNINNGGHSGAFGESSCESRISKKLMMLKLKAILIGINLK